MERVHPLVWFCFVLFPWFLGVSFSLGYRCPFPTFSELLELGLLSCLSVQILYSGRPRRRRRAYARYRGTTCTISVTVMSAMSRPSPTPVTPTKCSTRSSREMVPWSSRAAWITRLAYVPTLFKKCAKYCPYYKRLMAVPLSARVAPPWK